MKLVTGIALLVMSLGQVAYGHQHELQADNSSLESQLCLDAVAGNKSLDNIAKQLKINNHALDRTVLCNGIGITKFVKKYANKMNSSSYVITENKNQLKAMNANHDAKLCAIAASGDVTRLKSMSRLNNTNLKHFVKYSSCNNLSVLDFVAQFGGEQALTELKSML